MQELWQHLPEYFDPIAFSIGEFSVFWYSLMWLTAFAVCYGMLIYRKRNKEIAFDSELIQDIITNALFGALVGGRLGYVFFYDVSYYVTNPLAIISPYDFISGEWVGIYGMSYHGGVIGVAIAIFLIARKKNMRVLALYDLIVPVVPIGYMFGRIGNFLNQELVGRITTSPVGMYFNEEAILRHPSQLYEALFEGLILFVIMWQLRNKQFAKGTLSALYLMLYSLFRFMIEFYRAPDEHLGLIVGNLTMGQLLSIGVIILSMGFLIYRRMHPDQKFS